MGLALQSGITLAAIASLATSFRINSGAAPPTTYAAATSTTVGLKTFVAGAGFFTFVAATGTLSAAPFTGSVTAGGLAQWFSICDDTLSELLATAPLMAPAQLAATENNFVFSTGLTLVERHSSPVLTSP
jgi:hypothetical protein